MKRTTETFRADRPAIAEVAAGALVVHRESREILLLHHRAEARWCLPKGHVDPGESVRDAAVREVREETGLAEFDLSDELTMAVYRFFDPARDRSVVKSSIYFLAWTRTTDVHLESTFDDSRWVGIMEARRLLPYDSDRHVLDAASVRLRRAGG
ncbi:MAG TPA: NUDIX domain-containing protein [Thermoplasmata archaeon]